MRSAAPRPVPSKKRQRFILCNSYRGGFAPLDLAAQGSSRCSSGNLIAARQANLAARLCLGGYAPVSSPARKQPLRGTRSQSYTASSYTEKFSCGEPHQENASCICVDKLNPSIPPQSLTDTIRPFCRADRWTAAQSARLWTAASASSGFPSRTLLAWASISVW